MKFPYRRGNKERIAGIIEQYFPEDYQVYVELFFGAGGMFFNRKKKCRINLLNDIDSLVYDLYTVLLDKKLSARFYYLLKLLPQHSLILRHLAKDMLYSEDIVNRAVGFVYRSSYALYGRNATLNTRGSKSALIAQYLAVIDKLSEYSDDSSIIFINADYKDVLRTLEVSIRKQAFVYADPPYVQTSNNYTKNNGSLRWTIDNFKDLINHLVEQEVLFAVSEQDTEEVIQYAKEKDLQIHSISKQHGVKKSRNEILITNYLHTEKLWQTNE